MDFSLIGSPPVAADCFKIVFAHAVSNFGKLYGFAIVQLHVQKEREREKERERTPV